jgi:aldehyde:ferredoxin oxidoreductase
MNNGYAGKILHVDLSKGQLLVEQPNEAFYRMFMGGSALGAYYLLRNTPAGTDPYSPENTITFAVSVLTGAPISGQSRMTTVARSPLTNAIGDAECGGYFPAEMKFAGFDAIVVNGCSPEPVYLWIQNGNAELRRAQNIWGKTTGEVESLIRKELGDNRIQIAQCGPAGERLVRYANVMNMCSRANGRTGMGAVMGSKNLKAIAVRGKLKPSVADPKVLLKYSKWGKDNIESSDIYSISTLGTASVVRSHNESGDLPTNNWRSGIFDGWNSISGETLANTIFKERDTCYACIVRCKRVVEVKTGSYLVDTLYGGPEYETIAAFGSYCGIDDLRAISHANQLCNMYGIDTISCGATIAWAMDCFECGILTREDTGGIDLRFGNVDALIQILNMIIRREGFGDLLAEGSARAADRIGRGSENLVVAVKKQELPAHMPQNKRSLALIYAVNPFGADHMSHEHDPSYASYTERMACLKLENPQPDKVLNEEKVQYALTTQYMYSFLDSANLCMFVFGPAWQLYGPDQIVEIVRAITGWEATIDELLQIGERRLNLLRSFNAREGIGRSEDTIPQKLQKALIGGKSDGIAISEQEVEQAKDWYYSKAGWDVITGNPTRAKLEQLGLGWVADELEKSNSKFH